MSALYEEARIWADLDGCEPGDLLHNLVDAAERVEGGGYAMSDFTLDLLDLAIRAEIAAHETWIEDSHQDPEYIKQELAKIDELRMKP